MSRFCNDTHSSSGRDKCAAGEKLDFLERPLFAGRFSDLVRGSRTRRPATCWRRWLTCCCFRRPFGKVERERFLVVPSDILLLLLLASHISAVERVVINRWSFFSVWLFDRLLSFAAVRGTRRFISSAFQLLARCR